jgi:hypothetical protein
LGEIIMTVRTRIAAMLFAGGMMLGSDGRADEPQQPKKDLESLPAPKQLLPPGDPPYLVLPPRRLDTRWVWSLYAPDQSGRLRPRVILAPYGSYYLRDGEPYPWTTTQQRFVLPRTAD